MHSMRPPWYAHQLHASTVAPEELQLKKASAPLLQVGGDGVEGTDIDMDTGVAAAAAAGGGRAGRKRRKFGAVGVKRAENTLLYRPTPKHDRYGLGYGP
jgi:hypothetical protein